jgi:hypothetical protein
MTEFMNFSALYQLRYNSATKSYAKDGPQFNRAQGQGRIPIDEEFNSYLFQAYSDPWS